MLGDNDSKARDSKGRWFSDAVLIAAAPVVAYLFAYMYEAGFCRFFGIPDEFISPTVTTVFIVAGALASIGIALYWFTELLFVPLSKTEGPSRRRVIRLFPVALMYVALLILYGPLWEGWLPLAVLGATILFFEFVFPLITQRGKGGYADKLRAQDDVDDKHTTLLDVVARRMGGSAFGLLLILYMGLFLTQAAGRSAAMRKELFPIPVDSPNSVVLRIYGDNLITAQFKRETKTVEMSFKVVSAKGVLLRVEKVGPLTVQKE